MSRRSIAVLLVAATLAAGAAACDVRVAGTRCRIGAPPAQDSTHVLVCRNGRWAKAITKTQAAQLIASRIPVDLEASARHACAVMADTSVRCWGQFDGEQIPRTRPVPVDGLTGVVQLATKHTAVFGNEVCALLRDRTVTCWHGPNGPRTPIAGLTDVVQISSGEMHTCALKADGTVWCVGASWTGQLGNGLTGSTAGSSTPVQVTGLTDVVQIAAGTLHTCAVKADGSVWCWGRNDGGQLGVVGIDSSPVPIQVPSVSAATHIAAGYLHSCARTAPAGVVLCWGDNSAIQLGNLGWRGTPPPAGWAEVQVVAAHGPYLGGKVTGFNLAAAGQIDSDNSHTCALAAGGGVGCWGSPISGQLGNGSVFQTVGAQSAIGISGATDVTTSDGSSCAVAQGAAWCWGDNSAGQLGNGTTVQSSVPVRVQF